MICFPNAKINLGLLVTEKRADTMHNIETCIVPIPLSDVLEIIPAKIFSLVHYGLPIPGSPDDNLIVKAWNLLLSIKTNIHPVKVCLYKNIPIASGLGGGSSDAAFFLKEMNKLFSLGFSSGELELMAASIGADCSVFINNKTTLASGIGNIFTDIENPVTGMFVTVVFPQVHVSTKDAFLKVKSEKRSNLHKVLLGKNSNWKDNLKNDFEKVIFKDFPEIGRIKNLLYESGAVYSSLTGSGSAVYSLSNKPVNIDMLPKGYMIWTGIID